MLRRKTHRYALQTKGLSDEQAAQLMFLVCSVADSFDADYRSESNVPLRTLRDVFPDHEWHRASGSERIGIVR